VPKLSADERLQRLLAIIPWVASRDGPRVEEVTARFGCAEAELVADLELLFLCGLHPYTPDMLIDVDIAEGRVWIRYAEYFSRPLRLTPTEGLALLASGRTVLAYSFGRDERARRVIDPYAVFSAAGQWYVSGWCHRVDDERLFRVDRIASATPLDTSFTPPRKAPDLAAYRPAETDPRVTLELDPSARWVAEQYPVERIEEVEGGRLRVTLVASQPAWLERLLLRLGRRATVVEGDAGVGAAAARRLLVRYQG
jgi:proteasome accessory factor C